MTVEPAVAFWSGGKDSALALDRVRRDGRYAVAALITTINRDYGRVSMHGVREELVARQAAALRIPLHKMYVEAPGTNEGYIAALRASLNGFKQQGIGAVIFGDIFLEDLRVWRESLLAELGMTGVFPLWKEDTRALAREFVGRKFRALTCCINDAHLGEAEVGRALDAAFFGGLPADVDPCGENGEYHSFVHDGPIFHEPVRFHVGEKVYRPLDLKPQPGAAPGQQNGPTSIPLPPPPGATRTKGFWFVDLIAGEAR